MRVRAFLSLLLPSLFLLGREIRNGGLSGSLFVERIPVVPLFYLSADVKLNVAGEGPFVFVRCMEQKQKKLTSIY